MNIQQQSLVILRYMPWQCTSKRRQDKCKFREYAASVAGNLKLHVHSIHAKEKNLKWDVIDQNN